MLSSAPLAFTVAAFCVTKDEVLALEPAGLDADFDILVGFRLDRQRGAPAHLIIVEARPLITAAIGAVGHQIAGQIILRAQLVAEIGVRHALAAARFNDAEGDEIFLLVLHPLDRP
ncbi:hypothetical protein E4T56_gene17251, partial [Termitomyces sp. T112]